MQINTRTLLMLMLVCSLFVVTTTESQAQQTRVYTPPTYSAPSPQAQTRAVPVNTVDNPQDPESEIIVYNDSMQIMLKTPPALTVIPITTTIDGSEKPGMQIPVYSGDMIEVSKNWKKYLKTILKKRTSFQSSPSGDYYFTNDADIPRLSANTIDIYAELLPSEDSKDIYLNCFFDLGGAFLSPEEHPEKYLEAVAILKDFAVVESIKSTEAQLLLEEEELLLLKEERQAIKSEKDAIQFQIDDLKAQLEKMQGEMDAVNEKLDEKNQRTKEKIGTVEQLKLNLRSFDY